MRVSGTVDVWFPIETSSPQCLGDDLPAFTKSVHMPIVNLMLARSPRLVGEIGESGQWQTVVDV